MYKSSIVYSFYYNTEAYLKAYETLLSMGYNEDMSLEASQKCKGDIEKCISYITYKQQKAKQKANDEEKKENSIFPLMITYPRFTVWCLYLERIIYLHLNLHRLFIKQ